MMECCKGTSKFELGHTQPGWVYLMGRIISIPTVVVLMISVCRIPGQQQNGYCTVYSVLDIPNSNSREVSHRL